MKKIVVILGVVATMFVACVDAGPTGPTEPTAPVFPEQVTAEVESGKSYEVTFTTAEKWEVSLPSESQAYATLTYDGVTYTQFFGEAGEHTILVNIREGLSSYAKDYVVSVDITLREETKTLALFTVPKIPYEINIYGAAPVGMEDYVQSTFEMGGHPENGPFASAANTCTVRYLNRADAQYGDFVVYHDCDLLYNYVIYAKSSPDSEFEPIAEDCPWLSMRTFKKSVTETDDEGAEVTKSYSAFSLEMNYFHGKSVKTKDVGYEAYVNLEDENGDAIVSVYFIYDPTAVAPTKPTIELAYPTEAATAGVTFEGSGTAYTLTLPNSALIGTEVNASSLKVTGYQGGGFTPENLSFKEGSVSGVYHIALAEGATLAELQREYTLAIAATNADGAKEYTITVILDWIEATEPTE